MPGLQLDQDIINVIEIKHSNDTFYYIFYSLYYRITYSLVFNSRWRNKK